MFGDYENYPDNVHLKFQEYHEKVKSLSWTKVLPFFFKKGKLKKRGNAFYTICVFHQEKTASLSFNIPRGTFHCFGCGIGGHVFDFICKMMGSSNCGDGNIKAMKFVKRHFGIPPPFTKKQWREIQKEMLNGSADNFLKWFENSPLREIIKAGCLTKREYEEEIELLRINMKLQEIALENFEKSEDGEYLQRL